MKLKQLILSLKPYRREHWIMLSILIYSVSEVLAYYLPTQIANALRGISAAGFIIVFLRNIKGNPLRGFTRFAFGFLVLWSFWLTFHMFFIADVRGTLSVYHGLTTLVMAYLGSPYFMPNLLPMVLLIFPRNYEFDFHYLWRLMWFMCIIYLCYYPFAFWNMTHYSWSLDYRGESWSEKGGYGDFISNSTIGIASLAPVVLMVYFKRYINPKQWMYFLSAYVGGILLTAYMARRGGVVMSVMYLVMAWCLYTLNDKMSSKIKQIMLATAVIALGYALFSNMADSFFATLMERGTEDTRSGVEESFYADMKSDTDWIFGRGWFGQYYDPIFNFSRSTIETGYLALILRGGFLYLIPYVLILLLTFHNGYFRSNNLFCKSFAILCLLQVVSLYPYGWPAFNFFHLFVWLGVWICNNNDYRKISDIEIRRLLF